MTNQTEIAVGSLWKDDSGNLVEIVSYKPESARHQVGFFRQNINGFGGHSERLFRFYFTPHIPESPVETPVTWEALARFYRRNGCMADARCVDTYLEELKK